VPGTEGIWLRVIVGRFDTRAAAGQALQSLQAAGRIAPEAQVQAFLDAAGVVDPQRAVQAAAHPTSR
jgi:hypothetical protein